MVRLGLVLVMTLGKVNNEKERKGTLFKCQVVLALEH